MSDRKKIHKKKNPGTNLDLNPRHIATGALCHIPGARMVCSAFHFIKAVVSQKKTALLMKP